MVPTPVPTPPPDLPAPQQSAKEEQPRIVEPVPAKPPVKASALARQPKAPTAEEQQRPDNRLAMLVATFVQDGEKCFQAKQYDCAIAKANDALQVDPGSTQARRLKAAASDEQQRALKQIKIE
jgi:hypothetical protein